MDCLGQGASPGIKIFQKKYWEVTRNKNGRTSMVLHKLLQTSNVESSLQGLVQTVSIY